MNIRELLTLSQVTMTPQSGNMLAPSFPLRLLECRCKQTFYYEIRRGKKEASYLFL